MAGTGSHKPYLFNAENVARFAPPAWHSPGTVVDQPYDALERVARGQQACRPPAPAGNPPGVPEPALLAVPPAGLGLDAPPAGTAADLRGREVWLVHPWALRPPPDDLAADAVVIGIYPQDHLSRWPWPAARWRWVDAAMAAVAPRRWWADRAALQAALQGARRVRCSDDPHARPALQAVAELLPAPRLFAPVENPCSSFSQWWTRATRGLHQAEELL